MTARPVLLALLLAFPSRSHAQDPPHEHVVREGDTCASIAREHYGSASAFDRIHRLNPELGPPPHELVPGTVLRLATAGLVRPDASITAARRTVRARPQDESTWRAARVGQELGRGAQVSTEERSSAEITFRDRSTLQMREHTLVIIYGGSGQLARRTSTATLERGALRGRLDELAGRMAVTTPSSRTEVGGETIVSVGEDGTSRVANLGERAATVTAGGGRVRVPAGTGTIVRRGARPAPPRPLPDAPVWAQDPAGRFVGLTGRGGTLRGTWRPVEGASRYRVEVARRPDGTDVVAAVEVGADTTAFEIHRLPQGAYYLSVSTIDRDALEGRPSPHRAMAVLEARIIEPGGTDPVEQPYDPGDPSEPWSAPRVLPGTWVVSPPGLRCAGEAGDEPATMATLRTEGRRRVRCVDGREREVPAFEVDVVGVAARVTGRDQALVPGAETTIRIRLSSPLPLPDRLVARPSEGVRTTRVVRRGDVLELGLATDRDAPLEASVSVGVLAGTELVLFATVDLPVHDPIVDVAPPPERRPEAPRIRTVDAFAAFSLPDVLRLDDPHVRGVRGWIGFGAVEGVPGPTQLRASAGARAQVFDEPLRIGFAWAVDANDGPAVSSRGADADPWLSAAWAWSPSDRLDLALELGAWIPTNASENGLAATRIVPSIHVAYRLFPWLRYRGRMGVFIDGQEDAFQGISVAVGADARIYGPLHLASEADFLFGKDTVGVGGLGLSLHWSSLELVAGVARSRQDGGLGRWSAFGTMRFVTE